MLFFLSAQSVRASSLELSSTSRITFSFMTLRPRAKRKVEGRAMLDLGRRPNAPAVPVDDALDGRKSDSRPLELIHRMQPLKGPEQFRRIGHVEPRAIVADEEGAL